ncbi:hypothetical protein BZG36_03768 [Bifiguratus adelaidae]|uniref:Galactose-1-phosphate uridylyltransferase n=1 Tax=Bifiguratus adelaidae TaxID=1938954 RepID=A0A261Y099_9FUNG|nr:hypothetical protein BZG36_03768 [Bifiguratus adelaidae]
MPVTSEEFQFRQHSHRRFNPLTNSWVLCSPHRTQRPWQGAQEASTGSGLPEYDPKCYLCPGNPRANGDHNPKYESTYVFPNDFPAVKAQQPVYEGKLENSDLLQVKGVRGQCHVVCFSPAHNLTIAEMSEEEIQNVVKQWIKSYLQLGQVDYINHIQIFENKGSIMGCSNPHPHGQMWCTESIPEEPHKEMKSMQTYYDEKGSHLLLDYVNLELSIEGKPRVVCENDTFACVTPFWALWPFETMILPKFKVSRISDLNDRQQKDLANIIRRIACRYDNVFLTSFPYSMGVHQAPVDGQDHENDSQLHLHFYPPLLRSATVKKFLVGLAGPPPNRSNGTQRRRPVPAQPVGTLQVYLADGVGTGRWWVLGGRKVEGTVVASLTHPVKHARLSVSLISIIRTNAQVPLALTGPPNPQDQVLRRIVFEMDIPIKQQTTRQEEVLPAGDHIWPLLMQVPEDVVSDLPLRSHSHAMIYHELHTHLWSHDWQRPSMTPLLTHVHPIHLLENLNVRGPLYAEPLVITQEMRISAPRDIKLKDGDVIRKGEHGIAECQIRCFPWAVLSGESIKVEIVINHMVPIKSMDGVVLVLQRHEEIASAGAVKRDSYTIATLTFPIFIDPETLTTTIAKSITIPAGALPTFANTPAFQVRYELFVDVHLGIESTVLDKATRTSYSRHKGPIRPRDQHTVSASLGVIVGTTNRTIEAEQDPFEDPPPYDVS